MISVTLDADARVRLVLTCRLDIDLDATRLPPDVVVKPEVIDADLQVSDFRVNRISHFDGPIVRELGDGLEKILVKQIEQRRPELAARINRQIARHQDKLRISLRDTFQQKWQAFVGTSAEEQSTRSSAEAVETADPPTLSHAHSPEQTTVEDGTHRYNIDGS